jgi:YhcH/YjgK/YiaL family protein
MRKQFPFTIILTITMVLCGCSAKNDPSGWSKEETNKWFEKGEWLREWTGKPDGTVDRKLFAESYFKHKERWNKAFDFLKENDLSKLEIKRYDLEGDNLFAMVSEYSTKNPEDAHFEAHRKYIDLQFVIMGSELIGLAPIASKDSVIQEYDATKDLEFFSTKEEQLVQADNSGFFMFFPENAHRPSIKVSENSTVRKVVIKIKVD